MGDLTIFSPILNDLIEYPETDGEPMAETDFQRDVLVYTVAALALYFRDQPDVYVTGNILFYYEEGRPQAVISPDVMVIMGVEKKDRPNYKLWEEGKGPEFVLEVTSKTTRHKDQGFKKRLYAELGVSEYFLFDPTGDYLKPQLQGFRLEEGHYEPIRGFSSPNPYGTYAVYSRVLALDLFINSGGELRFFDPEEDRLLTDLAETEDRATEAEAKVQEAEAKAREAEAKAQEAEAKAEAEAAARQAAEQEAEALKALVAELQAKLNP
jgi:Uma2 family endonuclease